MLRWPNQPDALPTHPKDCPRSPMRWSRNFRSNMGCNEYQSYVCILKNKCSISRMESAVITIVRASKVCPVWRAIRDNAGIAAKGCFHMAKEPL